MSPPADRGALALVLHSHMPYVEGFGTWPFGEEWLWEAVATVYLPLLDLLDGAPVTVGLTPVLCDQLETMRTDAGDRFLSYLRDVKPLVHAEAAAGLDEDGEPEAATELRRAAADYERADRSFERRGRDLLGAFAGLSGVELVTSSATHAVLPLLATDAGLRLQLGVGVVSHGRRFGRWEGGFWLPECAYEPGLERDLAEAGVRAFCVDQTAALGRGSPHQLEPVATAAGPVAVPIDWDTVALVWGGGGYPAGAAYRDSFRRTRHDLAAWSVRGEPYRPADALAQAEEHARDFVDRVLVRLDAYFAERRRPGLVCCALDAELLGHFWYEGPAWLAAVLREAAARGLELVTLRTGLERVEAVDRPLASSSWGLGGDLSTWDSPSTAEVVFGARRAELRVAAAADHVRSDGLSRAARELLAAQSSDWPFQISRGTAGTYPHERALAHIAGVDAALGPLPDSRAVPEPSLRNLAPRLDLGSLIAP